MSSCEKKTLNKKIIAIIAAILIVIIVVSVVFAVKNKSTNEEETTTETTTVEATTVEDVETEETTALETETTEAPTKRKTVKEFVKNDLGIANAIISEGKKVPNGVVYFVDEPVDYTVEDIERYKNRYIIVDTGERFLMKELHNGVGNNKVYFVDVDGEKGEEIVLHIDYAGNGGYGSYAGVIYKVEKDGISTIFDSETDKLVTGAFESRLEAPFKAVVYCRDTGYEKVLDFTDKEFSEKKYIFDAEGNPIVDYGVNFDSFYRFESKDVDKDGIYEIVCRQYASLGSHVSCVGFTQCVFECDSGSAFVIDAKFTEGPDKSFVYPR